MASSNRPSNKLQDIFECVKLFEVEDSSLSAGGEPPTVGFDSQASSTTSIELCSWRETKHFSTLALFCSNGYLVFHVILEGGIPLIKQLKWFESRQKHLLGMTFDPLGEWLACACLDGSLCLIPVYSLLTGSSPHQVYGPLNDLTTLRPSKKKASPMSIVWWDSMDGCHICITGSEVGEITFFDLSAGEVITTAYVTGCIDRIMLAQQTDTATHLLVGVRGGEWKRMLLEEHLHEAAGTSYSDAHASGFEVLTADIVIKNYLQNNREDQFQICSFSAFSELTELCTHDWKNHHLLSALNLRTHKMEVYSYDFDTLCSPVRAYQLVPGATNAMLTDKVIFVISHDDEIEDLAFTLTVMSNQRAGVTVTEQSDEATLHSAAVFQQFTIPSASNLVGFYSTAELSHDLRTRPDSSAAVGSPDQSLISGDIFPTSCDMMATSSLGGCIVVTTTCVYRCCQKRSAEVLFQELALNPKTLEKAEEFGITFELDVCGLYKMAAERKITDKQYGMALKLFELSRCHPSQIISAFSKVERVPELVQYLHQLTYDSSYASLSNPRHVEDLLLLCFAHECLRLKGQPDGAIMKDKFTQFITDKFQYNQSVAIEILVQSGLKEQLFELAKSHHKLSDVLTCLVTHGSVDIDASILSSLASRQYVETLEAATHGLFLYQMSPSAFVRLLNAKPTILSTHLHYLHSLLPHMDIPTLLRLAKLLDPSYHTIRPLLIKAHSHLKRSNSTGSLVSMVSSIGSGGDQTHSEDPGPPLESYIEMFLTVLIILNHKRRLVPAGPNRLMSLSPLRSAVSGTADEHNIMSESVYTEGSQWVQASTLSGGLHHAALVCRGSLFTWGSTRYGKLGHGEIEEEGKATPLRVETLSMLNIHVVSVSCGAEHTVALCQEGVFSWGSSSHGQLGHGDELKKTMPVQIAALADKSIISIVCGQYHTLVLDDDQRVWSWGWGVHGQLGLKRAEDELLPSHVSLLDGCGISFIAAGYGHSAVLTAEGKVFTFGNGMYGQLGHGNNDKQITPKMVEALAQTTVYLLACGNFHTVAVTTDQDIFSWGKNMYRPQRSTSSSVQGLKEYKRSRERHQSSPNTSTNIQIPNLVTSPQLDEAIIQVSCGSFHNLLLTSAGSVYSWGSNSNGQLGHTHTSELTQPKEITGFNDQKIIAIATGDEFSLVVDDRGEPWTWGRADKGQLGLQLCVEQSSSVNQDYPPQSKPLFKPRPIKGIPSTTTKNRIKTEEENSSSTLELPVLELDLGWELPDFATIGSPHAHYGRRSLDAALEHLHGFYRTSMLLWQCHDWKDWESLAKIYNIEHQWAQAMSCSLNALVEACNQTSAQRRAHSIVEQYIQKFICEERDYLSHVFIQDGVVFLESLLTSWKKHCFETSLLENILTKHLTVLSYPLSLILRSNSHGGLSFTFNLSLASHIVSSISRGNPSPEAIVGSAQFHVPIRLENVPRESENPNTNSGEADQKLETLVIETSAGDSRLWIEVLRNISKDLSKCGTIHLSESTLAGIAEYKRRNLVDSSPNPNTEQHQTDQNVDKLVAFTCGHTFPLLRFQTKIVQEFTERMLDLPLPTPLTFKHLQLHYKQSAFIPSSCPYCVFQYIRKVQLQQCPNVPIKPWNPV